jgi:hypothetical protein
VCERQIRVRAELSRNPTGAAERRLAEINADDDGLPRHHARIARILAEYGERCTAASHWARTGVVAARCIRPPTITVVRAVATAVRS